MCIQCETCHCGAAGLVSGGDAGMLIAECCYERYHIHTLKLESRQRSLRTSLAHSQRLGAGYELFYPAQIMGIKEY
jgi:hypothetical protein